MAADKETERSVNRYSMPVTKSRTAFYDINLDQANTTGFLFGDDDNVIEGKLYTQSNNEDNFPVLRREPNMVSKPTQDSLASHLLIPCGTSTLAEVVSAIGRLLESIYCHLSWRSLVLCSHPLNFSHTLSLYARLVHLNFTLTSPRFNSFLSSCLDISLQRTHIPRFADRIPCIFFCTAHFLYRCCCRIQGVHSPTWTARRCFVPVFVC